MNLKFSVLSLALAALLVACPEPINPAPVIGGFTASPTELPAGGGKTTLSWNVSNAAEIIIDQDVGSVTGTSKEVTVVATKTFTLTAKNVVGEVSKTVTVNVAAPTPSGLTEIKGKLEGWTKGARTAFVDLYSPNYNNQFSTQLTATGEFKAVLPTPEELEPKLTETEIVPAISSCRSNYSVTKLKYLSIGNIRILSKDERSTLSFVTLTRQGNPTTTVSWLFVDRDLTVSGSCGTTNFAANFKHGWNQVLVETSNDQNNSSVTSVRTGEAPADVQWVWNIAISNITLENAPTTNSIEAGSNIQLTAKATDADGDPVVSQNLIWSSSNTSVASVDTSGLVTAKNPGNATITIKASNNVGYPFKEISFNVYGIQAAGGTYSVAGSNYLATSLVMKPSGYTTTSAPTATTYTLTGPTGWNNNQPATINYAASLYSFYATGNTNMYWTIINAAPVVGTYTLSKTGGQSTTFKIDAIKKIDAPSSINFTDFSTSAVSGNFTYPATTSNPSFITSIYDSTDSKYLFEAGLSYYNGYSFNLTSLGLDKTHKNAVRVFAISGLKNDYYSYDPMTEFNVAATEAPIDFKPIITAMTFNGTTTAGGNTVSITGFNLKDATSVEFGNVAATSISATNDKELKVLVPAGSAGVVDVKITSPTGTSSSKTKFYYFNTTEYQPLKSSDTGYHNGGYLLAAGDAGAIWYNVANGYANTLNRMLNATTSSYKLDTGTSSPNYFHRDTQGRTWYTRTVTLPDYSVQGKIGLIKPAGDISNTTQPSTEFDIPFEASAVALGADGKIWFLGKSVLKIGRMDTDGKNITSFAVAQTNYSSTGFPSGSLLAGSDGNVWFLHPEANEIGRITPTGTSTLFTLNANYYGNHGRLSVGPNNSLVFARANKIVTIKTDGTTTESTAFVINNYSSTNKSLALDANNNLWMSLSNYYDGDQPNLVRVSPTGESVLVSIAGQSNTFSPYVIADTTGRIWYSYSDKIGVLTP